MRFVPERSPLLTIPVMFASFLVGPLLGAQLGGQLAPGSTLGQLASTFAFPLAFFAGVIVWLGFGVVSLVLGGLLNLLRGRIPAAADVDEHEALVPPGYGSFVIFAVGLGGGAGLVVGLVASIGVLSALAIYGAAGAAYGAALWILAHHGYLPFPEPS